MRGHVVLCGLDGLGLRTLEELRRLGEDVVVVAPSPEPRRLAPAQALARVIDGSPTDPAVLEQANVASASAIVFSGDDDLANLDAALAAIELAPGIRIVIRIFELEFGRRIESLFPDCTALSASRLAAPGFVASALHADAERPVEIAERRFMVRTADADAPEVVVPLARIAEDGTLSAFPREGTDVVCLVEPTDEERAAPLPEWAFIAQPFQFGTDAASGLVAMIRGADRRLRYAAGALMLVYLLASLVFGALRELPLIDGLFHTTKALFGGVDDSIAITPGLKLFSIFLTLLGASIIALLFTILADAVLTARLARVLQPNTRRLRGHVVVCGLGSIGFRIVELLRGLGLEVVVAELDPQARFVEAARRLGARVIAVDARSLEALGALNVQRARALVVATSNDLANLETAVHARTLAPDLRIVVRLFDPQLAARLEQAFGSYVSRSTSTLAAPAFAAAAIGRQVLLTIPVGPQVMIVARASIEAGSPADCSTVGDEEDAVDEAEILALETADGRVWRPPAATTMAAGDALILVGTRAGVAAQLVRTEAAVGTEG